MSRLPDDVRIVPEAEELILAPDNKFVCETYIFEPSAGEEHFGYLFAAGEAEDNSGLGSELIDTVVTAIQKEYYRDPTRSPANSFEMSLHQANLILHDTAAQGVRDWMTYFHMSLGILVGAELHVSVAGGAQVYLARKSNLTAVSTGLAHYPITNALQTFSQVASGDVKERDTIFFSTSNFDSLFNPAEVGRFTLEPSAATVSSRLENFYKDQRQNLPLALVTVSLLPQYATAHQKNGPAPYLASAARRNKPATLGSSNIRPRQPLVIRRSMLQSALMMVVKTASKGWLLTRQYIWPAIKQGSRHGGRAIVKASQVTGHNITALAQKGRESLPASSSIASKMNLSPTNGAPLLSRLRETITRIPSALKFTFQKMPSTSKIFALTAIVLMIALVVSLVLLQRKRTSDQQIQQASEVLYEARTKVEAADTALIYDNREQATGLLDEASQLVTQLQGSGLYQEEVSQLNDQIVKQTDRLQRISRVGGSDLKVLSDTSSLIAGKPNNLFLVNGNLYTVNPDNNSIIKITGGGEASIVHQTTQGIGFINGGAVHPSDKTVTVATTPAGIALFDTTNDTLLAQDIQFPNSDPNIADLAVFGNRLYIYDSVGKNIFVFNKTLRGYSSGTPWITDESFQKDNIKSFGIDGNVFTLQKDGSIKRLFKGQVADFVQEKVEPGLVDAKKIIASEDLQYVYVLDPSNKRIVIYTKEGALVRQLFVEAQTEISDVAIDPDEKRAFVLDGTRILEISLADPQAQPTP